MKPITSREITRFIANLDPDEQSQGFEIFDKLCGHYGWQGTVVGSLDIQYIFNQIAERPITETELEDLQETVDVYDILAEVAMRHLTEVVSQYIATKQEESE